MQCGNCGAESQNYYGYKGGRLCPVCYGKLREASASERRRIETKLAAQWTDSVGRKVRSEHQQMASLVWIGVVLILVGALLIVSTYRAEGHLVGGLPTSVAWLAIVAGIVQVGLAIRAEILLRRMRDR